MIELRRPDGRPIKFFADWSRPKRDFQWKPGRSAMELAKAWFRDDHLKPPVEMVEVLTSAERLSGLRFILGIPELVTRLPERGEGRNHDLALLAQTPRGLVTVCIEAKADEPFGNETVLEYWERAVALRNKGNQTRAPERIHALLEMVGSNGHQDSCWNSVRYQLLTAICGTTLQARKDGASLAVFLVHEFLTHLTRPDNIRRNQADFETFLTALSPNSAPQSTGALFGPFEVNGIDCLVGKATVEIKG